MVEFSTILSFIQAGGIIIGVAYYILNIENNRRNQKLAIKAQEQSTETRRMELFLQIWRDFNSQENINIVAELFNLKPDYEEYLQKYDSHVNPSFFARRSGLWYFFNSIGELLRLNYIDPDLLNRLNMDINVIVVWENWAHIIKKNRAVENMPDLWDGFEYLYNEMKSLRDSKGYPEITYNP